MKTIKNIFILLLLLIATSMLAKNNNNITNVTNEKGYNYVDISKNDTSRIECKDGKITDLIYSKDKEFTVRKLKNNAFIKLSSIVTKSDGNVIAKVTNTFNRELYIECNKKLYSFILVPKVIPAQTIVVYDPKFKKVETPLNIQEAKKFEQSRDYESALLQLNDSAYKEETPTGYSMKVIDKVVQDFKELSLTKYREYKGSSYTIYEYLIKAKTHLVDIKEKSFLEYVDAPLSMALSEHELTRGEVSRLFVVSNNNLPRYRLKEETEQEVTDAITNFEKNKAQRILKAIGSKKIVTQRVKDFIGE